MQTNESESTGLAGPTDPGLAPGLGVGIARGAAVIAGLTLLSRLLGLVRTLVFSQTVGASCLGAAYVTANQVPNLLYELVLGGALTSAMVRFWPAQPSGRPVTRRRRRGSAISPQRC